MRTYGNIPHKFWLQAKEAGLSDKGKMLMVYLMSCPHGNSIGCFRLPAAYISDDLDWPIEVVVETLSECVDKLFLEQDSAAWLRIKVVSETTFGEEKCVIGTTHVRNPNMAKSLAPFIEAVPKTSPIYKGLIEDLQPLIKLFPKQLGFVSSPQAVARSSSNYLSILPSELEAAREPPVDNSDELELDLNEPNTAAVVVAKMVGRRRLSRDDMTVLLGWTSKHNLEADVLPWLEKRVANYLEKHGVLPAHPLSYFSAGLTEHLAKSSIKK